MSPKRVWTAPPTHHWTEHTEDPLLELSDGTSVELVGLTMENMLGSQWIKSSLYASFCRLRYNSVQTSMEVDGRVVGWRVFRNLLKSGTRQNDCGTRAQLCPCSAGREDAHCQHLPMALPGILGSPSRPRASWTAAICTQEIQTESHSIW